MSTPTPSQPPPPPPPGTPPLRCPRCDSNNTKFCYYNNYSLSQPRHFCKTCRRYWTKGGSLRNIPIGGASRKTKKLSRSSKDLKLFHSPTPNFSLPLPTAAQTMSSSIESLSAHNLELHWKLQQQRMSLLYTPPATTLSAPPPPPSHVFFQNMEAISNPDTHHDQEAAGAAEWFFDNSNYGAHLKNKDVNHGNPTSSNFNNNNNDAHGWPAADDDLHFHQFNGLV